MFCLSNIVLDLLYGTLACVFSCPTKTRALKALETTAVVERGFFPSKRPQVPSVANQAVVRPERNK